MVFPLSEIEIPLPALNVTSVLPDVFEEMTEVVPLPALTVRLPSFDTLPSTSVAVRVMTFPLSEILKAPAAVKVTPV